MLIVIQPQCQSVKGGASDHLPGIGTLERCRTAAARADYRLDTGDSISYRFKSLRKIGNFTYRMLSPQGEIATDAADSDPYALKHIHTFC
ncbi:MAG: hypothetical protein HFI44_10415 [Lachnospiraceae bacterium]|nr:hypothetical protein [Lachnospiraceae bacterium]